MQYVHGLAEATPFEDSSFDLVTVQFVVHECTAAAIANILTEGAQMMANALTLRIIT